MTVLFNTPLFLYLVASLLSHHIQECQSVPMELLQPAKKSTFGKTIKSLMKKPQANPRFALNDKDDLDDDYVLIEKVNSESIQSMIKTQSPNNQYLVSPNKKLNQASGTRNPKIEKLDDYVYISRRYITGAKNLKTPQSTHNAARESKPENIPKGELELKEKVQGEIYKSSSSQESKAENMRPVPVKEESDTMWFWNEEKELEKEVSSIQFPELKEQIEFFLKSNRENSIENLKKLGERLQKEETEETKILRLFLQALLKRSNDQGRLKHIQEDLKKILEDNKTLNEVKSEVPKKEEKGNSPLNLWGLKIGPNVNKLPPNHKANWGPAKGAQVRLRGNGLSAKGH